MAYELFAVLIYVAVLLGIGVAASRRSQSMLDYFVGGRRMGPLAVAFSTRSTGESAWLLLGLTGFGAAFGVRGFWIVLGEVLGVALSWLCMAKRFRRLTARYDSITVPDYLESRFGVGGRGLRLMAAGALLVFVPIYVSAQIHATGEAFSSFLGWNYYAGAVFGLAIVLLYVTRGGFVAVVWSDVFQALMMLAGLVALPVIGVAAAGGLAPILDSLQSSYPEHFSITGGQGWSLLTVVGIVGLLGIGLGFLGSPQVYVRLIALRSERLIPTATVIAIVWTLLTDTGAVLVGIIGRALIDGGLGTDGQAVLPELVAAVLPSFAAGLYIAIVLAAIMSTVDSLLVVASSAAVRDYYQKTRHPEIPDESLLGMSRQLTVALALAAFAVAMLVAIITGRQGVFWYAIFGWSGIAATFCPTMILSLFWPRMTALGAKSAMLAGFLAVSFFQFVAPALPGIGSYFDALEELTPAFIVSAVVGVLASLWDRRGRDAVAGAHVDLTYASDSSRLAMSGESASEAMTRD
jgi:sodium/proline symporter